MCFWNSFFPLQPQSVLVHPCLDAEAAATAAAAAELAQLAHGRTHTIFSFFFFSGFPFHPLGSVVVVVVVVVESSVTLPHSRTRALTGRFEVDLTQWSRQSFQPRRRRRRCFHHHRRRLAATAAVQMEVLYSPFSPFFTFHFSSFLVF